MPRDGSSALGENWLKLGTKSPAAPVVTVRTPLGPDVDEPPELLVLPPLLQAARVATARTAAAVEANKTCLCLFIVDTLFPVTTGTAGTTPRKLIRCVVIEALYRLSVNPRRLMKQQGFRLQQRYLSRRSRASARWNHGP